MLVSTKLEPSLAVAAANVLRRPLTRIRVEPRPRPRRLTLLVPCVAPEVNESGTFSEPLLTVRLRVMSEIDIAPISSMLSREMTSIGVAPSVGLDLM